jgi:hypothetical protein
MALAGDLLGDVAEARRRLRAAGDAQEFHWLARSVAALCNAHVRVAAVDQHDPDRDGVRSLLGALFGSLQARHGDGTDEDGQP